MPSLFFSVLAPGNLEILCVDHLRFSGFGLRWDGQATEGCENSMNVAVIKAACGVAGVVARECVLQGRLAWAVGGDLDPVCVFENLPSGSQVGAGIEQRFRINRGALLRSC